ncbi:alpha/beta fold hydrolase [Arthrobacter caoxuetaonis]|uniref:Alpha/beta hydrolase n=1 Tax=Arthrobacter caoxuetaonis TaxID=2886935 RepID=A0A9X1SEX0_9MICC|nr:alpha/beta hydrolase [Arthrobacter caoxuetaonis]MCC3298079.1 alpha/beta hydrolase [Arthrobacter caoxuetaonis]USQ57088.1 alpha/beta hydrolase [Arthrobacter caoxuetaonis]
MNTTKSPIVLIAGHWLGAWAWDEVLEHLAAGNARATALTLPGLDPEDSARTARTLDEQAAAITDVVTRLGEPVTLVAHSGANFPVSLVLDRHPQLIHRMVWADSGPVGPGSVFLPGFPEDAAELPLPAFGDLGQQASLDGLSDEVLGRFRNRAVPEPGPVLRQPLELENDARRQVPTTLVCCSIPGAQMMELARSGHPMFAETAELTDVEILDLPTGHWPMWSRPRDLAEVIAATAS